MKAPLSQSQLGVYYACVSSVNEETNYQNPVLFTLPESTDINRLREAVYAALNAHPYLAGHIVLSEEGMPEYESGTFPAIDVCVPISETASIDDVRGTFAKTMDIYAERLYRCEIWQTKSGAYLYLDFHHVLTDGFTIGLLLHDIERVYGGKRAATEMLDGMAIAEEETAKRADEAVMGEAKDWYGKTFCDAAETDSLPIKEAALTDSGVVYKHYRLNVDKEDLQTVERRFAVKESTVIQAAFAQLLATYSAEDKASYCTAYFGRADRRTLMSATMMVHTLPVFVQTTKETTIEEWLQALNDQMELTQQYRYYAYQDAVRDLGLNNQVMFVYQGSVLAEKRGLHLDGVLVPYEDLRQLTPGWKLCVELFEDEQGYSLKIGYDAADYSEAFMQDMADCYSMILHTMATADKVSDLEYCSERQLKQLDSWKGSDSDVSTKEGLVARFRKNVAERPDSICVVAGDTRLTYAEVDKLSDTVNPEYTIPCGKDVIGYSVPRNEQMVIVPLSIAKAGMTAMPLDSSYPEDRLEYMKGDATKYHGREAFILLYTSGTTGTPKGVMLSEHNLLAFFDHHIPHIGLTHESRYASYAGYGFDAYMHDLWACMSAGAAIHIIGDDIRFDLTALYEYFCREHITHAFMTTQVATQMVINYPDIPGMQFLGTGGEKLMSVNPPSYRFLNGYGPTEASVYVCSYWVTANEANIPIGFPNKHVELFIVNKYGKRVPCGASGELIAAGPQVGLGYLNLPEKTQEAFVNWNGKRCYRTGDIVRYRADGAIEFVGRKDGQVKIRGFRIELKEVESVIRQYPGIKDATVQAFDDPAGGKFIAAYIVSDEKVDIQALNVFIADQKPPYMVPAATMQIDAIPLNQNQKVNRRALPEPVKSAGDEAENESAAPLNVLEEQLKQMVVDIVGTDRFGITTPLQYVGLTSISAIRLATQVYKRFGVTLDTKAMVHGVTIQAVENAILEHMMNGGTPTAEAQPSDISSQPSAVSPQPSTFPLSYAQTGVYFDCMKNPVSTLYNIPMRVRIPEGIAPEQVQKAVETIVLNHPELHVQFKTNDTGVVQEAVENPTVSVELLKMTEAEADAYKTQFVQPFNLSKDQLFRFALVQTDKALFLYCDIHHLVCDGASYDIFFHELCTLLEGQPIEPELCSYARFVQEQKAAEQTDEYQQAKDFFHSQLSEVEGPTEVPDDLTDPAPGETEHVFAPLDLAAASKLANSADITPAGVALGAVFYALSRFANTDRVCITTISNGRSKLQMAQTMGMLVNTLALSAKVGDQKVLDFLRDTGHHFEQTLTHEYYPFAQIAADYDLTAEIMFAYQIGVISEYRLKGQLLEPENMELNVPKFKIAFYIMEVEGKPSVVIEYDNGLYSKQLMQSLAEAVSQAVEAFSSQPDASLTGISLLSKKQTDLLDSFNLTDVDYDATETIVSLFTKQAAATPDNIAVVYTDRRYTYRQVDELSDRIAAYIAGKGLKHEDVVSVLIPRCEWMAIASLGVLKAGCAYQPLDPSYPAERLNFMMQDANAKLLIAEEELRPIVNEYQGDVLLTKDLNNLQIYKFTNLQIDPSDLFILLYTSGSTGVPKGCQLTHANLVAFCHWYQRYYDLRAEHKVAAYASYGFDACMMDMYPALTCGAAVHIISEDIRLNMPDLNEYFNREGITHSFMTTQIGYQFATNVDNHSLLHLSVGGEKLATLTPPTAYKFHNGYGPTECTIFTTTYEVASKMQNIPIGRPLDNMRLYIVDPQFNRLPLGAVGELWVSGPQVSRGYLNRPEKTAETYIANPFTDEAKYARIYRTGDIVRYLPDGNIQFVGRRDGQVKIRGFRIELKEVEAVIREYPGIKDATVQAFDYENGGKFIAAYIVSDETVDIKALNAFIAGQKPSYMVPAATMQIDAIPLNQNQKVNRRALPEPVIQASDREYVEPVGEQEKLFAKIFSEILSMEKVGATDNFFDLGGTSLMVTRVIIEADKAGMHVAYGDIFANPTPRDLARFVSGDQTASNAPDSPENYDYTAINRVLEKNNLMTFLTGERQPLGDVLLTGATGYLGIHVLRELIDSEAGNIYCLVRGESEEAAESRLRTLLYYYFANAFKDLFGKRLHVINGDFETLDTLELQPSALSPQPSAITVFNCAANVKHFSKGTDIEDVNIGGTQHCVDFCLRTGARLVHVSTTSVGGMSVNGVPAPDVLLCERNLFFGQKLNNQYAYSKFIAERIILEAVAQKGLNAKIMRVGNLSARSTDGEFQVNFQSNSYMGRIKVYHMLGCCPYALYDMPAEFSPINETARAVVLLASAPKDCTVFQPYNNHTQLLGDILAQLAGITHDEIRFVEMDEFGRAIEEAKNDPAKAKQMTSLLAYQDMAHGQQTAQVERENNYTSQALHRLGFFWSTTSWDYDRQMLNAIAGMGFFE